jgi:membrane fusion protein, multidrug efflux system
MSMNRQSPIDLENNRPAVQPEVIPDHPERSKIKDHPRARGRHKLWLLVAAVAVGAAAYFAWPKLRSIQSTETSAQASARKGRGGGGTVSAVAAKAQRGNIGVYFTALGAVTPIYTVTVKSRVDGQLMKVLFKEGQIVQEGDPLLEIDTRPYQAALEQVEGQLARDQALLKNAQLDLERYKVLATQEAIPQQQLATQDALVAEYQGTIKADQATVDAAKLNLFYCHIASPITGLVGLRLVDPGNIVHASDASGLVVITQLDPISVIFTLAEDQLPAVLGKMSAGQQLPVEAWDRDLKNELVQGTLQTIDNQIDPTTGTLKLRATFENQNRKLFPSQFVNVRLLVEQKYGVTLVPSAAIQRNTQGAYVWLVKPDQTVTVRSVTVGTTEGEQTQISSGLQAGDVVVTVGVDRLQEGSTVNAQVPGRNAVKKQS